MRVKKERNIQIGERIKAAREMGRLTQEQLAEQIEVSPQYVSDLERGVVGISIPTLTRLCVVLGVSSDQILFDGRIQSYAQALAQKCDGLTQEQFLLLMEIVDRYKQAIALGRASSE